MNIPEPRPGGKQLGRGAGEGSIQPENDLGKVALYGKNPSTALKIRGNWPLIACIVLTGSLCLGLGMIIARENQKPNDSLWIEQLPKNVLPGSVSAASSTSAMNPDGSAGQGSETSDGDSNAASITSASLSASAAQAVPYTGAYVASKTGKKYYLPSCGAVKRIKEENKVWFSSKAEAEKVGYSASTACIGL